MGINKYFGPFDKKGNIINQTVVECECDQCGYTWTARYKQAKGNNEFCRGCTQFGPPYLPQQVFEDYPEIVEIGELSARGGITNDTIVSACCPDCNLVYDMPFRNIKKVNKTRESWRCHSCAQIDRYNDVVVYPEDVPDNVLSIDETTLGHRGQLKNSTVIELACDICGQSFDRYWMNFDEENNFCSSCTMKIKWEDEEFAAMHRESLSKSDGSYMSSGHYELKQAMIEAGINNFESERWLGPYRVDEINYNTKTVVEYYGSYWHADPRLYQSNDIMFGGRLAREIWEYDDERVKTLQSYGYAVIVVWEKDFKENKEKIIEGLLNIIGLPTELGEYEK